jgi:dihydrolipoamide dehydrogenase
MAEQAFDLIVIGSGPGGYIAAIRAAQLGLRVACVEKDAALGGTCLNVGCIPSKALLDSSEHFAQAQDGLAVHGVKVGPVSLDLPAMLARKDKIVKTLTTGIAGLFRKNKVERVQGLGRIVNPSTVEVRGENGARSLATKRILIATGSEPIDLKDLPFDGQRIISSTEALRLPAVPRRMLVVGGGAIGLELGSVWSRLGSEVVVAEFMDRIVPGTDVQMGRELQKALTKQGLKFHLRTSAKSASIKQGKVSVTLDTEGTASEEVVDVVLVAVGRRPHDQGLGAREAGVTYDERGRIKVGHAYVTSVPGIYAIGDVIAGPMLAHKAEEEGVAAVEQMAGIAGHVNYDAIPNVVYTWPELASVGLSEEEAGKRGLAVKVGSFPFIANARARCLNETEGLVKMLADAKTDRIVGVHILGPRASDLIAEAALAMEFGASAEDIARSVHAHPTLPEAIREAALAVDKRALNV